MQLLHLYYFKLLAENEHLLNTAKQIHISPPALSSTISKLEAELNVVLFDRIGRNIKLNNNGKILYVHVCNIFSEIDKIQAELSKQNLPEQITLKVGVTTPSIWNEGICHFMIEHPDIPVNHSILHSNHLNDMDYLNNFDLILTDINDISNRSWESRMVIEAAPVLLVNKNHPFASRKRISLYETRNENFIALSPSYSIRTYFDDICKKANFIPKIIAETDFILRNQLIMQGSGITIGTTLGTKALSTSENELIVAVPLDSGTPMRILSVFTKKGVALSREIELFRDYIIDYYKKYDGIPY